MFSSQMWVIKRGFADILWEFFQDLLKNPNDWSQSCTEQFLAKCKTWAVDEDKTFRGIRSEVKL